MVRNDDGLIKIFINGEEFAEYDDSETQKFVPGEPDNFIVFFRDHPSVLANEASPGFVSDIIIGNAAWTPEEVVEVWEDFCSSLLDINEIAEISTQIYPNPAQDVLYVSLENTRVKADVQIFDLTGRMFTELRIQGNVNSIDVSHLKKGMYLIKIIQDSKVEIHKFKKE